MRAPHAVEPTRKNLGRLRQRATRGLLIIALFTASVPLPAQAPRSRRESEIVAVSQAMIALLETKNFSRARHLCEQLIVWEPENPVHHYNLACIEACTGAARRNEAFAALEQAVRFGFADAPHMQADSDLVSLRDDPRFADLLRRVAASASAAAAVDSVTAPVRAPAAQPASHAPEGPFVSMRPATGAGETEFAAWYFSPDGRVFQNPRAGVEMTDLSAHRGLKGNFRLAADALEVTWANSPRVAAPLAPTAQGFEWNGLSFTPARPVADPARLVGTFVNAQVRSDPGELTEIPRRVELRADGSARWQPGSGAEIDGRWELAKFSLRLIEADGSVLRLLALPLDSATPAGPASRLLLGGAVFRRS